MGYSECRQSCEGPALECLFQRVVPIAMASHYAYHGFAFGLLFTLLAPDKVFVLMSKRWGTHYDPGTVSYKGRDITSQERPKIDVEKMAREMQPKILSRLKRMDLFQDEDVENFFERQEEIIEAIVKKEEDWVESHSKESGGYIKRLNEEYEAVKRVLAKRESKEFQQAKK